MIGLALRSRFAIIRQCAAKCFATIGDVMAAAAMRYVIETIVPFLGDTVNLCYRQGATELLYRECSCLHSSCAVLNRGVDIVQKLDIKALPYVIFMIVPVLGRMSDSDDDIRSTATNTFASLVKMVPLEVRPRLRRCFSRADQCFSRLVCQILLTSPKTFSSVEKKKGSS